MLNRLGSLSSQGGRLEWGAIVGLTLVILAAPWPTRAPTPFGPYTAQATAKGPVPKALRQALRHDPDPALRAFYAARGYRPLWARSSLIDTGAEALLAAVTRASEDDLRPADFDRPGLEAKLRRAEDAKPVDLASAELALSRTLARYGSEMRTPLPAARMLFADPGLRPPAAEPRAILEEAARSPSLPLYVAELHALNPMYAQLRAALASALRHGSPPARIDLLRANMERARALPADLGSRYVWVNAPAQMLWMRQGGHNIGSMSVVVGKPSEPTPVMTGVIRYVIFHPYWNVPPDLVRDSIAPAVLRSGPRYLAAKHLQVLSDWSDHPQVVPPEQVDWAAVASGGVMLRVRQLPGRDNMMGQVKFMFPNAVGEYLHDTPLKKLFGARERIFSSGCVRLEHAAMLTRWLLPEGAGGAASSDIPEQRVNAPQPTPVYLAYLTAVPTRTGIRRYPDIYHRDAELIAEIHHSGRAPSPA